MKLLKILTIALGLVSVSSFSQDYVLEELPVATINSNLKITLDEAIPLANFYKVDITELEFVVDSTNYTYANEFEVGKYIRTFCTGNIVTPILRYSEGYVVFQIHADRLGDSVDRNTIQSFIDRTMGLRL